MRIKTSVINHDRIEVAPGVAFWAAAEARIYGDDVAYDVVLELVAEPMKDGALGQVRCAAVTVESETERITSELLRAVPVAEYVKLSTRELHMRIGADGSLDPNYLLEEDVSRMAADGPTDETLARVAYVYRLAAVMRDAPVVMVHKTFGVPRGTASRWVSLARQRGLLGETQSGRAGG